MMASFVPSTRLIFLVLCEHTNGDVKLTAEIAGQANLGHQDPLNKHFSCPIKPAMNRLQFSVILATI